MRTHHARCAAYHGRCQGLFLATAPRRQPSALWRHRETKKRPAVRRLGPAPHLAAVGERLPNPAMTGFGPPLTLSRQGLGTSGPPDIGRGGGAGGGAGRGGARELSVLVVHVCAPRAASKGARGGVVSPRDSRGFRARKFLGSASKRNQIKARGGSSPGPGGRGLALTPPGGGGRARGGTGPPFLARVSANPPGGRGAGAGWHRAPLPGEG